ncbi:MAG: hypothetical protein ACRYGP_08885 [Janthinobacterium lividum]
MTDRPNRLAQGSGAGPLDRGRLDERRPQGFLVTALLHECRDAGSQRIELGARGVEPRDDLPFWVAGSPRADASFPTTA